MTPTFKAKLKEEFCKCANREPTLQEEVNMENDYILVMRVLLREQEELDKRVKKLETK